MRFSICTFALLTATAALAVLPACAKPDAGDPVLVFAAASTGDAVQAAADAFTRDTGVPVRVNLAASSVLARQIESGASADIFLSASEEWADYLSKHGLVADRRDLVGNRLVVVAPADAAFVPKKPEDLLSKRISRVAVADPASVPAGVYARQALTRLRLWDRLQNKLAPGLDVREALMAVERGEAEAGIVYATDAAASSSVRLAFAFDPGLTAPIRYPVVLVKGGPSRHARRFYDYISSPESLQLFRERGFELPL